ncbi:hypothetical protein ElyMa_000177300 [Elysia marginata]|uniref:Uncharacterized protein n=1 Tax=Elysia marginata TaxID=1093978 RepID=A0AAV4EV73_9GAST|nr:hypothetical protein ElyMa_000177300 [Elysia marginata]
MGPFWRTKPNEEKIQHGYLKIDTDGFMGTVSQSSAVKPTLPVDVVTSYVIVVRTQIPGRSRLNPPTGSKVEKRMSAVDIFLQVAHIQCYTSAKCENVLINFIHDS